MSLLFVAIVGGQRWKFNVRVIWIATTRSSQHLSPIVCSCTSANHSPSIKATASGLPDTVGNSLCFVRRCYAYSIDGDPTLAASFKKHMKWNVGSSGSLSMLAGKHATPEVFVGCNGLRNVQRGREAAYANSLKASVTNPSGSVRVLS